MYYSFFCSWVCWHLRGLNCCLHRAILALQWHLYLFFSMRWSMCVSIALAEVKLGFWILNLIVPMTSLSFLHEIEHVCLYRIGESQLGFGFWLSSPYFFLSFPNSSRRRRRHFFFFISFESWLWRIVWCRCVADFGFHSLSTSGFIVFVPWGVEQKL